MSNAVATLDQQTTPEPQAPAESIPPAKAPDKWEWHFQHPILMRGWQLTLTLTKRSPEPRVVAAVPNREEEPPAARLGRVLFADVLTPGVWEALRTSSEYLDFHKLKSKMPDVSKELAALERKRARLVLDRDDAIANLTGTQMTTEIGRLNHEIQACDEQMSAASGGVKTVEERIQQAQTKAQGKLLAIITEHAPATHQKLKGDYNSLKAAILQKNQADLDQLVTLFHATALSLMEPEQWEWALDCLVDQPPEANGM